MDDNFAKACKEIVEILKFVPDKDVLKIPKKMREMFEYEMDKNYNFSIDTKKTIEEQKLLNETKAILSNIFRDYWATPYQRERIIEKQNYDRKVIEQQKSEKYNPNNIFKRISTSEIKEIVIKNNPDNSNLPVDVKKEKFYQKIVNFIKKIFSFWSQASKMKFVPVYRHEYRLLGIKVAGNDAEDEIIYIFFIFLLNNLTISHTKSL